MSKRNQNESVKLEKYETPITKQTREDPEAKTYVIKTVEVIVDSLNVRKEPRRDSPVICIVHEGQKFIALDKDSNEGMYMIGIDKDNYGWICEEFVVNGYER